MGKKSRTTITIDKETRKAAKKLGISLSSAVEMALKGFHFSSEGSNQKTLADGYDSLFKSMTPLLRKYGAGVLVAEEDTHDSEAPENEEEWEHNAWYVTACPLNPSNPNSANDYQLCQDGENTIPETVEHFLNTHDFCPPDVILNNFVTSLAKAAERNHVMLREIAMAKRIIHAISGSGHEDLVYNEERDVAEAKQRRKRQTRC